MKTQWKVSDISKAIPIHPGGGLEFQDNKGEWHNFEILEAEDRVVFGGVCNVGFIESGYILKDDIESLDETLSELLSDLETYYNNGPQYVSRIVVSDHGNATLYVRTAGQDKEIWSVV